ncbi:MAG TPA: hypothetical protein VIX86_00190 [Streptosporangiaceae bacterium]
MFNVTSGQVSEPRVIYHPHCCPTCSSAAVAVADIDTGGGLIETALICLDCGDAWPLACVAEWGGTS